MKKYTNRTSDLKALIFRDGSAQFLMRGQSFITDAEVVSVPSGVVVRDVVRPVEPKVKKASA